MLVSIEKELDKQVKTSKENSGIDVVFEVNQILNNSAKKDLNLLKLVSPNSDNKELNRYIYETKYNQKIYHIDEIKNIAIDYRLKFLLSIYYTGKFDNQTVLKIKNSGLPTDSFSLGCKYYILAPQELFNVRKVKYKNIESLDPLLFYKIDENYFCLIHKWGNDFTLTRKIEGWKWKNFQNYTSFYIGLSVITSVTIFYLFQLSDYRFLFGLTVLTTCCAYFIKIRKKINRKDAPNEEYFTPKRWNNVIVIK